ncbi:MAG: sigma 54-interacting transcriptional regulator [Smithellaceae bacterium]
MTLQVKKRSRGEKNNPCPPEAGASRGKNGSGPVADDYKELFHGAPAGYLILNHNSTIIQANDACASLLGTKRQKLVQRRFDALVSKECRPAFSTFLKQVFDTGGRSGTNLILLKDNDLLSVRIAAVADATRKTCRVIFMDIDRSGNLEASLLESKRRYKQLVTNANSAILRMDQNGIITFFNEYAQKLFGYTLAEILGRSVKILLPRVETGGRNLEEMADIILRNPDEFDEVVNENIKKNGDRIWVSWRNRAVKDSDGNIIGNLSIGVDITAHKQAEEALQKTKEELELRVESRTAELRTALCEIEQMKDRLEAENIYFRQENKMRHQFENILGQSDGLKYVLYRTEQVAPTNTTVLILGETGTGKELIASAIHHMSPRRDRPLITVNCAALPANLIESELFGREKGAFTGADSFRAGRFEIADGSTLCLDEIGELPLELQAKLLRVIQDHKFERLGSSRTIKVDVRIVATTNRDLEEEVRKGRFRQDLYYRLNVFPITVPPLRQRVADIPILVQAFVQRYARKLGKQITSIQKETRQALQTYPWPGNIRELESVIERAVILCPGPVLHLADELTRSSPSAVSAMKTLRDVEKNQITKTLSELSWRIEGKNGAAEILGVHPSTLRSRMVKLGIVRPKIKNPS